MLDRDFWTEVLQTIKGQKLRSLMTAFGVFWGLLMLMFLIGAGMGFHEGCVRPPLRQAHLPSSPCVR